MRTSIALLALVVGLVASSSASAQAPQVLLYGDSLTSQDFFGNPGYAHKLVEWGWDASIRGSTGESRAQAVERLQQHLASGAISANNAAIVLFWGTNDLEGGMLWNSACMAAELSFWRCEFEVARPEFLARVETLQGLGLHVIVVFPPPLHPQTNAGNKSIEFTRYLVKRDVTDLGVAVLDLYDEFKAMGNPGALMSADGVHLNDWGDLYVALRVQAALTAAGLTPSP